MKRIYPGRRPSKMGFAGSIFSIAFGILWTILAFSMTRGLGVIGVVFPLFGVLFVGLGIVHSMAHGLGALYDTPHGVANAIILPVVMEYNAPYTGEKYREIARAMGVEGVDAMTQEEYRKAACDAVRKLGQDVGIPADLKAIVKDEDVQFLAESAFAEACRPGNPRDTSVEEIAALYRSMM